MQPERTAGTGSARVAILAAEQITRFREEGLLHVPGVFAPEDVEVMRQETDAILRRAQEAQRDLDATWRGAYLSVEERAKVAVLSVHDLQFHSALFARMLVNERLTALFAALVGPNVQLHHNKLHSKPPERGAPFPLHQDHPYFPHAGTSMTAAVVHLDDATVENGCLRVVPGSHALGPLAHEQDGGSHYLPLADWPLERAVAVPAKAGDLVVFGYLTVHGSGVNRSQRSRRVWIVQVRDPEDRPLAAVHLSPGQGTMLRGVDPTRFRQP